jgi:hypothetical protein
VLFSYIKGYASLSRKITHERRKLNMENETVKQENATVNEEKTFTQAELDQIIGERLKREREKYVDYDSLKEKAAKLDEIEEASKSELQKATEKAERLETELSQLKRAEEIRGVREAVATQYGIPTNLLSGETEETCTEQAKALLEFKSSTPYPNVRDGGELTGNMVKGSNKEQFADWFNGSVNIH